jgi:hypothetical protein
MLDERTKPMKKPLIRVSKSALAGLLLAGACVTLPLLAGNSPLPGNSHAYGKTLAQWEDTYWRWTYGGLSLPTNGNGNAVVGHVVMMPLPNAPGDGTPAHLDVTLSSGQPFVLPLWVLLGTDYSDGTPPDPLVPVSVFQTLQLSLEIDGVKVVGCQNMMDYYSGFYFSPPVPLNFPPVKSIIWFEGIGTVHTPFSVGTHTIKLDAKNTQGAFGAFFEYHNTWTVTVRPGK